MLENSHNRFGSCNPYEDIRTKKIGGIRQYKNIYEFFLLLISKFILVELKFKVFFKLIFAFSLGLKARINTKNQVMSFNYTS